MKNYLKKGCGCLLGAIVLAIIVGVIVTHALKPQWNDEYGERFQNVSYGNRQHNTYDLYLPTDAGNADSLALILYVHGGSWLGGDKAEHHGDCYQWVRQGYATATMNYSFLDEEGVSLPTMYDEIDSCIRHIVRFASVKGIHIRQMAIAGTSAGGHLSMMYAYSHPHPLPLRFEAIKVGPADFRILFPHHEEAKAEEVERLIQHCTGKRVKADGGSKEQLDSIKLLASPVFHINASTALPAIFAYGGKDWLITPPHYQALQAIYDSLGKPYDLIVFPHSGHNLRQDEDCAARYDSTLNAYCKKYFGY